MEKFFKSFFHPNDKKKGSRGFDGAEEDRDFSPPLDGRRKLSISRSGRMKQNKKRHSLTQDLYGDDYHAAEKPSPKEYHVHGKSFTTETSVAPNNKTLDVKSKPLPEDRRSSVEIRTPEEEIDIAFQIIDKS